MTRITINTRTNVYPITDFVTDFSADSDFVTDFYNSSDSDSELPVDPALEQVQQAYEDFESYYETISSAYARLTAMDHLPIGPKRSIQFIDDVSNLIRNLLEFELIIKNQADLTILKNRPNQYMEKFMIYKKSQTESSRMVHEISAKISHIAKWDAILTKKYGFLNPI